MQLHRPVEFSHSAAWRVGRSVRLWNENTTGAALDSDHGLGVPFLIE